MQLGRAADELAVQRVLHQALDQTVTVFCILLLTTRPDRAAGRLAGARSLVSALIRSRPSSRRLLLLARSAAASSAARCLRTLPNWSGFARLAGGALHAQIELLAAQLQQLVAELASRRTSSRSSLALPSAAPVRFTNEVCTESFAAARRNASRAIVLGHALHLVEHLAGLHRARPSTRRCPCRCPCALRAASW